MILSKELTTVTRFSKLCALFLFILLPIVGFACGMQYQRIISSNESNIYFQTLTQNRKPTPVIESRRYAFTVDTTGWKTYQNKGFSTYSIRAPAEYEVNLCEYATFGGYCEGQDGYVGVYREMKDFPYGLVIEQTTIKGLTDEMARQTFSDVYENSVKSDIDFGDSHAVMKHGKDTEDIHGTGTFRNYFYTKYIFRHEDQLYFVSIRTRKEDDQYEYNMYKTILKSWKFE